MTPGEATAIALHDAQVGCMHNRAQRGEDGTYRSCTVETHALSAGEVIARLAALGFAVGPAQDERETVEWVRRKHGIPCPGGCACVLGHDDPDASECGCDSYCTLPVLAWPIVGPAQDRVTWPRSLDDVQEVAAALYLDLDLTSVSGERVSWHLDAPMTRVIRRRQP
jgi:hypothetical protein